MRQAKRGIIFVQKHNSHGHDATGAFLPKAKEFANYYGITDVHYIDNHKDGKERAKELLTTLAAAKTNLEVVAYFGHGLSYGLATAQIYKYDNGGVREFSKALRKVVGAEARLLLYACSAGVRGGWAEMLSGAMGPNLHIFGHDRAGHCSTNPYVTHYPAGGPGSEYLIPGTTHHPQWKNWVCQLKCERTKDPMWLRFPWMTRDAILAACAQYDHEKVKNHDEHCPYHHHNLKCEVGRKHPEKFVGQTLASKPAPAHARH